MRKYKLFGFSMFFLFFGTEGEAQSSATMTDTLKVPQAIVTGSRFATDPRHLPMSVSAVGRDQIERRYESSLLPLLTEQVPGLFTTARGIMGYGVSNGGSGGMSLRGIGGSPTTGVLILIDGHPQYMGLMGHPLSDAYQSMLAERVEVVRGPASVLYGSNAMGGVINILTRKQQQEGLRNDLRMSYGSFNTLTTDFTSRYRNKGFSSVVALSYNRTDGHRSRMDFEQYGVYAKAGYEFLPQWSIFADVSATHFNASNPGTIQQPILDNSSHITRGVASLSLENSYRSTSGALKFFYNWGRHKIDEGHYQGQRSGDSIFNSRDLMLGVNWYQNFSFFKGNHITAGIDYQLFGGEAWNAFKNGRRIDLADKTENETAGYLNIRQDLGTMLTADAGLRVDRHSAGGTQWIPQVGVSLNLSAKTEVKLLASRGFRNPTIREMYMFPPQNSDLRAERLWNYELSWTQRLLNDKFHYSATIFRIDGNNMIQTIPVNGRPLNVNIGKVENSGMEFSMGYRLSPSLSASANYTYLYMKHPVPAAPKHKLYVGVDYIRTRWSLATGVQYVDGLHTSAKSASTEHYLLWNLRGSYNVSRWAQLFLRGENLLNQRYEINAGFPMPRASMMAGIDITF